MGRGRYIAGRVEYIFSLHTITFIETANIMKRIRVHACPLLLIAVIAMVSISDADAQHLRYKTKTKMNLKSLGFLGSLLDSEMVEEVSINGNVKRVDRKDASTITNLDTEQIINLDHKRKEYSIMTFDEMVGDVQGRDCLRKKARWRRPRPI